jgi:serine/threonine-protein phosphatase 2A regulatory subunit B'
MKDDPTKKRKNRRENDKNAPDRLDDLTYLKPLLQEPESNREDAFIAKLRQCKRIFDFNMSALDLRNKEVKRASLNDLVEYICNSRNIFNERTYKEIVECVE